MNSNEDYYEVLGVNKSSTQDQIRAAYRNLAKEFHPDRHSNEGDADLANYAIRMSRLSEAYEVLGNEESRRRYDELGSVEWKSSRERNVQIRRPNAYECMFCAYHPVATATLRRNVGMVFFRRHATFTVRACRGCGMNLAREMQNSTLAFGWLGVISFFANLVAVFGNAVAIIRFNRLDDPKPPVDQVARPIWEPSYQGKSIFLRTGVYVAAIVLVIAGAIIGNDASKNTTSTAISNHNWATNECVSSSGHYITGVVSCSSTHFGTIVAIVLNERSCPQDTTNYFTEDLQDPSPGSVVCIDNSE